LRTSIRKCYSKSVDPEQRLDFCAERTAFMSTASSSLYVPPAVLPPEKPHWFIGQLIRTLRNQIEGWPKTVFEADSYRPPIPRAPLFIMHPDAIKTVLLDDADNFPQGELFKRIMRPVWGKGLLPSEGKAWKWQRNASSHAFRPADMTSMAQHVSDVAQAAIDNLSASQATAPVDIDAEMTKVTFDVIINTLLSGATDFSRAEMQEQLRGLLADISKPKLSYFFASDAYHANQPDIISSYTKPLLNSLKTMVRRRRSAPPAGDLVDLLLKARDPETDRGLDDDLMADNLLGFIMAGHETTARTLTWALFLVATHPKTADRILDEVISVAGGQAMGADHVSRLIFTRQVISEAQRLYPGAFQLTRVAQRDTILAGETVAAGTRIIIPTYALHRHKKYWTNPHSFDPDRFAPDADKPNRYRPPRKIAPSQRGQSLIQGY
jgi:cytochrome P450